jgi:hypothetical protein
MKKFPCWLAAQNAEILLLLERERLWNSPEIRQCLGTLVSDRDTLREVLRATVPLKLMARKVHTKKVS